MVTAFKIESPKSTLAYRTPTVSRVGGGYKIGANDGSPESMPYDDVGSISRDTLRALPHEQSYTGHELRMLAEILRDAERAPGPSPKRSGGITFPRVLQAYDRVLARHGLDAAEDTRLYRFILKLSLDPSPDWWAKFDRECEYYVASTTAEDQKLMTMTWFAWRSELGRRRRTKPKVHHRALGEGRERRHTAPRASPRASPRSLESPSWDAEPPTPLARAFDFERADVGRGGESRLTDGWNDSKNQLLLSLALSIWKEAAEEEQLAKREAERMQAMAAEAIRFADRRALDRSFHRWQAHGPAITVLAVSHRCERMLSQCFGIWARDVKAKAVAFAEAVGFSCRKRMGAAFYQWFMIYKLVQGDRLVMMRAESHFSFASLSKFMKIWLYAVLRMKGYAAQGDDFQRLSSMKRALTAWRHRVALTRTGTKVLDARDRALQRDRLGGWRRLLHAKQRERSLLARCVAHLRAHSMATAFRAWLGVQRRNKDLGYKLEVCALMFEQGLVRSSLLRWKAWHDDVLTQRGKSLAVIQRLKYLREAKAIQAWVAWYNERVERKQRVKLYVNYMLGRKVFYFWQAWCGIVGANKSNAAFAMRRMQMHRLWSAFNGFRDRVYEVGQRRRVVARCVERWKRSTCFHALNKWRQYSCWKSQTRDLLLSSALKMRCRMKETSFDAWHAAVSQIKATRAKMLRIAALLADRKMSVCFCRWRDHWLKKLNQKLRWQNAREAMEAKTAARYLNRWILKRQNRIKIKRALVFWDRNALGKAFLGWLAVNEQRKRVRALMRKVVKRWQRSLCEDALLVWINHAYRRRRARSAIVRLRSKRLHAVIRWWWQCVMQAKQKSERLVAVVNWWANQATARAWNAWRANLLWKIERRAMVVKSVIFWKERSLCRSFLAMRDNVRLQKAIRKALSHFVSTELNRSFQGWSWYMMQRGIQNAKVRKAMSFMLKSTQRKAIWTWTQRVAELKMRRRRIIMALGKWRGASLHRALASWKLACEYRAYKKAQISRALCYWTQKKLSFFVHWQMRVRHRAEMERKVAAFLAKATGEWLRVVTSAWLQCVRNKKMKRRKALECMLSMSKWRMGAHLMRWREALAIASRKAAMNADATRHWAMRKELMSFELWFAMVERAKAVRLMAWRHCMRKALVEWHSVHRQKKELAILLEGALLRWAQREMSKALDGFKGNRRRAHLKARAASHMIHSLTSRAFATWHDRVALWRHKHGLKAKALARWKNTVLASCFAFWMRKASEAARVRGKVLAVMTLLEAAKAFNSWLLVTHYEPILVRALRAWRQRLKQKAMKTWMSHYLLKRLQRRVVAKCVSRVKHRALSHWRLKTRLTNSLSDRYDKLVVRSVAWTRTWALKRWVAALQRAKHRRTLKAKAARRFRMIMLRKALLMWGERASKIADNRNKVSHALYMMRSSIKLRCFDGWCDYVHARQQKARAQAHLVACTKRATLFRWESAASKRKTKRARAETMYAHAAAHFANHWLWLSFSRWREASRKHCAALAFLNKLRMQIASRTLVSWRLHAAKQAKVRACIARTLKRRLRESWRGWNDVTAHGRRELDGMTCWLDCRRGLARKMSNRLSQPHAARSWDAWVTHAHNKVRMRGLLAKARHHRTWRVLHTWMSHVDRTNARRCALCDALCAWRATRLVGRCLGAWRGEVALVRSLRAAYLAKQLAMRRAIQFVKVRDRKRRWETLAALFVAWRLQASKYRKLRVYLEGRPMRIVRGAMWAWRAWAQGARERLTQFQQALEQVHAAHRRQLLSACVQVWIGLVALRAERAALMRVGEAHNHGRLVRKAFAEWKLRMVTEGSPDIREKAAFSPITVYKAEPRDGQAVGISALAMGAPSSSSSGSSSGSSSSLNMAPFLELTTKRQETRSANSDGFRSALEYLDDDSESAEGEGEGEREGDEDGALSSLPVRNILDGYETPFVTPGGASSTDSSGGVLLSPFSFPTLGRSRPGSAGTGSSSASRRTNR